MTHVPQLEHVVAFLSKHADGILKDKVDELQNELVKLRSLPFTFSPYVRTLSLTVCATSYSLRRFVTPSGDASRDTILVSYRRWLL